MDQESLNILSFGNPELRRQLELMFLVKNLIHSIKFFMEDNGISLVDLSRRLGKSPASVRRLLDETNGGLKLSTLFDITNALSLRLEFSLRPVESKSLPSKADATQKNGA